MFFMTAVSTPQGTVLQRLQYPRNFCDPKEAIQDTRFELIEKKDAESIYHVSQSDFQPGEALAFLQVTAKCRISVLLKHLSRKLLKQYTNTKHNKKTRVNCKNTVHSCLFY